MMTYEPKTDPNTGVKYVELTENDGCKFIENLPDFKDEAEEKAYYENLEKVLNAIDKARARLHANVNVELALELLFMTIREV